MKKAYGYCRASTGKQDLTFEVQRRAIEKHYEAKLKDEGYEWGGFYEDKATSGGTPFTEREKGRQLWVVAQPGDAIVWSKMDRAFRSVRDGANTLDLLKKKGIAVHSLDIGLDTSSALGDFVCKLLMLLGELERSWVSTRTREAMAAKRALGQPINGSTPAGYRSYGSKKTRQVVVDQNERELLEDVYLRWKAGKSMEDLSNELFFRGVKRYNGSHYARDWLIYAMHARAIGYPKTYDRMAHRDFLKSLDDAGKLSRGKRGMRERVEGMAAARAARQESPEDGQGVTSVAS
jgi:DNA invertase Pin-like site-specific DNA recombinase